MNEKKLIEFSPEVRPVYSHLEPIVDLLLQHGNSLAREYRWGENRTGHFCLLSKPIDFELIKSTYEVSPFVHLEEDKGLIGCAVTWATIFGGASRR
jgi:hypothetical protein